MKYLFLIISLLSFQIVYSQSEIKKFYYPDGSLSSEGTIKNGKPDGYWKTYYKNSVLKSEGNRKNFELDSIWKFYDEKGRMSKSINYSKGLKNGFESLYKDGLKYEAINYVNNVREGEYLKFSESENIVYQGYYANNERVGKAYEYADDGRVITIEEYSSGALSKVQRVNRMNSDGKNHGLWVWFDTERNIVQQGNFKNGLKHGYFKTYDKKGNLLKTTKYNEGEIQEDALEIAKLEFVRTYYPDKKLKSKKSYRNNVADGVHQEFDTNGKAVSTVIYNLGIISSKGGIIDEKGKKQQKWTEYFETGEIESIGNFKDGLKVGEWIYYYPSGEIEQKGSYVNGKSEGEWVWYYKNANILRKENFVNGLEQGLFVEYDLNGNQVVTGNYEQGKKQGTWKYLNENIVDEGKYDFGQKTGLWKQYNKLNNTVYAEISYFEGILDGQYRLYSESGVIKVEGQYESGLKQGVWKYYNQVGVSILSVTYRDDIDIKYNNTNTIKVD